MGLSLFSNSSAAPSSSKFDVLRTIEIGPFAVAEIRYHQATNFDGLKILVFRGVDVQELQALKTIDPHFSKGSKLVARFRPDADGWYTALKFCRGENR